MAFSTSSFVLYTESPGIASRNLLPTVIPFSLKNNVEVTYVSCFGTVPSILSIPTLQ